MADNIAIRVDGLSKRYELAGGVGPARYRTLREDVMGWPRRLLDSALSKTPRREFWALRNLSFEIGKGEVVGIIGRNGAGKSTLLKILSRIIAPTTGSADLFGRIGSLLEVGTGFHPELTGRENIFLSGAMLGMRRAEIRAAFEAIVAFAEVEAFIDTPCKHYSSGMYTRLGFAIAAHLRAEILLVDEVLAVGDESFRARCLGKMSDVARDGRTVVLVSHDLAAMRQMTGRCLWLNEGQVARSGMPGDVIGAYLDDSVRMRSDGFRGARSAPANSPIWFAEASLSGDGAPGVIRMGQAVTLRFSVRAAEGAESRPVRFAIGIRTEEGIPIALAADIDSGFEVRDGVGTESHFTVSFDDVRFYPGRYFLRLWVGGLDALETFDDRPDCLMLHVVDGGSLSSRRLLRSQGVIFLQPTWSRESLHAT